MERHQRDEELRHNRRCSGKQGCALRPLFPRTLGWYLTLILLLLDPLYLSILYSFVGGGDMNGIVLICPEWPARIVFGLLGVLHLVVIARYVYPAYKRSFATAGD